MKKSFFERFVFFALVLTVSFFITACGSDDEEAGTDDEGYVTRQYTVMPTVAPYGVGIDFESDSDYTFEDSTTSWSYDILVRTIKGYTSESTGSTEKGAPCIKLYKQTATAYKYSLTGKEAFEAITSEDVDTDSLKSDSVEDIDASSLTFTEDGTQYLLYSSIVSYYKSNLVTLDSSNWLPSDWTVGESEVIFIIKTAEGNCYKLMILGMGTSSGSAPGSGTIELAFGLIE